MIKSRPKAPPKVRLFDPAERIGNGVSFLFRKGLITRATLNRYWDTMDKTRFGELFSADEAIFIDSMETIVRAVY